MTIRPFSAEHVAPVVQPPHELVQIIFTSGTTGKPKAVATRQCNFVARSVSTAAITGRLRGARVSYTAVPGVGRTTGEVFGTLLNGATLCAFDARSEPLEALAETIRRERISTLR